MKRAARAPSRLAKRLSGNCVRFSQNPEMHALVDTVSANASNDGRGEDRVTSNKGTEPGLIAAGLGDMTT